MLSLTQFFGGKNHKSVSMNIEEFREYCLLKPGVTEEFPFGEDTLVFKVMGKIFALTHLDGDWTLNLKCDPEWAVELREKYPAIIPGYHMNKVHWNTVIMDGSPARELILKMTDHSYRLAAEKLTGKQKAELKRLGENL
jgi:predicted DNA-binding protein (MmcQ/YjbR family)